MNQTSKHRFTVLSSEKRQLLSRLLQEKGIPAVQKRTISRCSRLEPIPLSFAQQRLWFLDQLAPGNPAYNDCYAIHLLGSLDVGAFSLTLNEIIRRHESLRTSFRVVNGQPTQVIAETMQLCNYANVQMCKFADSPIRPFANSQVEGGDIQKTQREAFVQRLALEAAQQPFDLARGPLLRLKLLRLSADEHVLFWMVHHIISDGLSFGVFLRELAALYQAFSTGNPSPLPALPIQYADFAVWERQWVQGEFLESRLSYWKRQLQGPLPVLDLPVDRPRPPIQTFRGAGRSLRPPKSLVEALKTLGRQEEVTLFMTLLATFQTLLHAYTGQEDILVGTPISTRRHAETEGLIGLFINTLVLRTDLSGNPSVRELLRRVRKVCLEAYAHQEVPFEKLVEALKVGRDLSRNPLFQVLFLQHALPQPIVLKTPLQGGHEGQSFVPPVDGGQLTLSHLAVDYGVVRLDLAVWIKEAGDDLSILFQYNTELFDGSTIGRLLAHFEKLLRYIVMQPDVKLKELIKPLTADFDKLNPADPSQRRACKESRFQKLKNIRRIEPAEIKRKPIPFQNK